MSDPQRWRSDPDAPTGSRELLAAAAPTPTLTPEMLAASAARVAALPAGGATGTVAGGWTAKAVAGLGAVGVTTAVVLAVVGSRTPAAPPPDTRPPRVLSAPAAAPLPAEPPPIAPDEPASVAAAALPEPPAGRPARPITRPTGDPLARETAMLEEARGLLARSPRRALAALREHETTFPHGQLEAEREVMAIDALGGLGRGDAARRRAQAFLARFPRSPQADRMRSLLEKNR